MNWNKKSCGLFSLFLLIQINVIAQHHPCQIKGQLFDENNNPLPFVNVIIKNSTEGTVTNEKGKFNFTTDLIGKQIIKFSYIGFEALEKEIMISSGKTITINDHLKEDKETIHEVVVRGHSKSELTNKKAYNVQSIELDQFKNKSTNISQALAHMKGIKIRESGGVGSNTQLSLNGMTGRHIKIFIDGVPQEEGSAFSLNNMPSSSAERIEVYDGVVPVEFGSDAIGGVINIVTKKKPQALEINASYTYGSFNTHKSDVSIGKTLKNGIFGKLKAYQNYSDNDYYVNTYITEFQANGFEMTNTRDIRKLKRFNDTYHNEAVMGQIGIMNKSWADMLTVDLNYSKYYKEIQTGVVQYDVYGDKYRTGYTFLPKIAYIKKDLLLKGLNVNANMNYNDDYTVNIDTTSLEYNWLAKTKKRQSGTPKTHNKFKNKGYNGNICVKYDLNNIHTFVLSHVLNSSKRVYKSLINGSNKMADYGEPVQTTKNITGASYLYKPNQNINATGFVKYYNQFNKGTVTNDADGLGVRKRADSKSKSVGYGAAGTYFIMKNLQIKLSYEHAYRLPGSKELFGNGDTELGKIDLKPEISDNYNINLKFNKSINKHYFNITGNYIIRDTKDYIKRGIGNDGGFRYGVYENHGQVQTKGYSVSARYKYDRTLNIGGTLNNFNARDNERYLAKNTGQHNPTYGQRMRNLPYLFANIDFVFSLYDILKENDDFTIFYDLYYQHEFPLNWEAFGYSSSKHKVPNQISHNISLNYALDHGKYNVSLECRNITDEKLFDNYSLQKPGRAFYLKLRMHLVK